MITDDESEPGAWARELAALGTHGPRQLRTYSCPHCAWTGDAPSITDASVEREGPDGVVTIDRPHRLVCPRCFAYLPAGSTQQAKPWVARTWRGNRVLAESRHEHAWQAQGTLERHAGLGATKVTIDYEPEKQP